MPMAAQCCRLVAFTIAVLLRAGGLRTCTQPNLKAGQHILPGEAPIAGKAAKSLRQYTELIL